MRSAVAILTWNRIRALAALLESLQNLGNPRPFKLAVFEDSGYEDDTVKVLSQLGDFAPDKRYLAVRTADDTEAPIFLGTRNLGVAGNSNRALKWFMEETDAEHLVLLNDDVLCLGDFADLYARAHQETGIGIFCFCRLDGSSYTPAPMPAGTFTALAFNRMTGAGISLTRKLVEEIGYFDCQFGKFGEEHCDFTNRARLAGHLNLHGNNWLALDVQHDLLAHQDVPSSMAPGCREKKLKQAESLAKKVSYGFSGLYRPCLLQHRPVAGIGKAGISVEKLPGYGWA